MIAQIGTARPCAPPDKLPHRGSVHLLDEIGGPSNEVRIERSPVSVVAEGDVDRAVESDAVPAQLTLTGRIINNIRGSGS
jgi:hypothetical protein